MFVSLSVLPSLRRLSGLCAFVFVLALIQPAWAQTTGGTTTAAPSATTNGDIPGCNPNVMEAGNRMSEARVAAARAQIVDAIPQPPSVLQQTCFNQATGVAAQKGGDIFSGDFTGDVQPIVGSALSSLYSNFEGAISSMFGAEVGGAIGSILGGAFGGSATTMQANYDCDGIDQTWQAMVNKGVTGGMDLSIANMLNGTAPSGASENFLKSWQASQSTGVFSNAQSAMNALPRPQVQSYSGNQTLCEVMGAIGLGGCN